MPLPKPNKGEEKDTFISRCMSNDIMKEEYPKEKQRVAICYSQWKKEYKASSLSNEQLLDDWRIVCDWYRKSDNNPDNLAPIVTLSQKIYDELKNRVKAGKLDLEMKNLELISIFHPEDKITINQINKIKKMTQENNYRPDIARAVGCSNTTVYLYQKRLGLL